MQSTHLGLDNTCLIIKIGKKNEHAWDIIRFHRLLPMVLLYFTNSILLVSVSLNPWVMIIWEHTKDMVNSTNILLVFYFHCPSQFKKRITNFVKFLLILSKIPSTIPLYIIATYLLCDEIWWKFGCALNLRGISNYIG